MTRTREKGSIPSVFTTSFNCRVKGKRSLWWLKKTDLWLLLEYNAALEVRSGILTQPGQYLSENVRNTLKLCFDCCVLSLCMENSKEVFVCCRNKTKYEEDSFSVFIQRLTYSTIASASAWTDVLSFWWRKVTFQHTNLEDGSVSRFRDVF